MPPAAPTPPGDVLRSHQSAIAAALVARQFAENPSLDQRYGPAGREKCLQDAHFHLSYLADAMNAGAPELFSSYVGWAKVMLGQRGIPADDLARHLAVTRVVVAEHLDGTPHDLALAILDAGIAALPSMPSHAKTHLVDDAPHVQLARAYLESLLAGERRLASRLVLDAVAAGVPVKAIYLHVFQRAQYEVGRLWQVNEISVAQEHYCTAATQLIMSQLYSHIFAAESTGGTLVATGVAGDLHEIGMRMVADFFEMEGWNTYYLGANTPAADVIRTVVDRKADILGVSVTISNHLPAVSFLIAKVRADERCRDVKILVGGYPFVIAPELWRKMGADGFAPDAQAAIILANQLRGPGAAA